MNDVEKSFSILRRLAHTKRYSGDFSFHQESVLEHTAFVTLYALSAFERFKNKYRKFGASFNLLIAALLHDIEEGETGDIRRPTKYSSAAAAEALHEYGNRSAYEVLNGLNLNSFYAAYVEAKGNHFEGLLLRVCDLAAVAYHVQNELYSLRNEHFERVRNELRSYMDDLYVKIDKTSFGHEKTFLHEEIDMIREIVKC